MSSRAQLVLFQGAPERGLLVMGYEGFSPQILRDKRQAKLGSPRPCLLTWALRRWAKLHSRTARMWPGSAGPQDPPAAGWEAGIKETPVFVP